MGRTSTIRAFGSTPPFGQEKLIWIIHTGLKPWACASKYAAEIILNISTSSAFRASGVGASEQGGCLGRYGHSVEVETEIMEPVMVPPSVPRTFLVLCFWAKEVRRTGCTVHRPQTDISYIHAKDLSVDFEPYPSL